MVTLRTLFKIYYAINYISTNMFDILSVIISALTLILGYCAYKQFIVRKAKEQQLDVVLKLISTIQESKNKFSTMGGEYGQEIRSIHSYSVFEIAVSKEFDNNLPLYFYDPSVHSPALKWDFYYQYSTHPLLPNKIASILKEFDPKYHSNTTKGAIERMDVMLIGNIHDPLPASQIYSVNGVNSALSTARNFKNASDRLKREIADWLKSYGVNNVNM